MKRNPPQTTPFSEMMEHKRKREQAGRFANGNSNSSPSVLSTSSTVDQRSISTSLPRIHSGPVPSSLLESSGPARRGTMGGVAGSISTPMQGPGPISNVSSDGGQIHMKVFKGEMRKKESGKPGEDWMSVGSVAQNPSSASASGGPQNATRHVPYTITNSTTPKELIHIIKTLQEELDQRTISVNAIQRNFERLGTMYKANQEELDRLREALQQSQSEAQASDSEEKLLVAMKLELENLMHRHEALKDELKEERTVASERQYQFELDTLQQQELLKSSEEKINALTSEIEQKNKELEQLKCETENAIKQREEEEHQSKMERTKADEQRRCTIESLLKTVLQLYSTRANSLPSPFLEQIHKAHSGGKGPVTATSFTLNASYNALELWVEPLQSFLRFQCEQLNELKREDSEAYARWAMFSTDLLRSTLETHKQVAGKPFLDFSSDVLYHFSALRQQISHDVRKIMDQSRHKETVLHSEIQRLQQASGEDRQDLLALHNVELSNLKEQLLLISEQLNTKSDELRMVEMERDQVLDKLRKNKEELEKALQNAKALQLKHTEEIKTIQTKYAQEINEVKMESIRQQSRKEEEYQKHIRALQANLQAALQQSQVASESLLAKQENLLVPLQKKLMTQFDALVEASRSVETSARRSITHEEAEERQVLYIEFHKRLTDKRIRWMESSWYLQEREAVCRADLKLEEVTACTAIVLSLSTAINQDANEKRLKKKMRDWTTEEETLRNQVQKREKECIALREEHKKDIERLSKKFQKELSEAKLLEGKCDALEVELRNAKVELEKQHVDTFQIQKSTLASVQCLIAAEEASESTYSCPMCFQLFQQPVTCTPCGHTFCENCIKKHPRNASVFKNDSAGLNSGHMKASFFCPECRSHCCDGLLETKCILDLSSKFQYKKKILRDIVISLQRAGTASNA